MNRICKVHLILHFYYRDFICIIYFIQTFLPHCTIQNSPQLRKERKNWKPYQMHSCISVIKPKSAKNAKICVRDAPLSNVMSTTIGSSCSYHKILWLLLLYYTIFIKVQVFSSILSIRSSCDALHIGIDLHSSCLIWHLVIPSKRFYLK